MIHTWISLVTSFMFSKVSLWTALLGICICSPRVSNQWLLIDTVFIPHPWRFQHFSFSFSSHLQVRSKDSHDLEPDMSNGTCFYLWRSSFLRGWDHTTPTGRSVEAVSVLVSENTATSPICTLWTTQVKHAFKSNPLHQCKLKNYSSLLPKDIIWWISLNLLDLEIPV